MIDGTWMWRLRTNQAAPPVGGNAPGPLPSKLSLAHNRCMDEFRAESFVSFRSRRVRASARLTVTIPLDDDEPPPAIPQPLRRTKMRRVQPNEHEWQPLGLTNPKLLREG